MFLAARALFLLTPVAFASGDGEGNCASGMGGASCPDFLDPEVNFNVNLLQTKLTIEAMKGEVEDDAAAVAKLKKPSSSTAADDIDSEGSNIRSGKTSGTSGISDLINGAMWASNSSITPDLGPVNGFVDGLISATADGYDWESVDISAYSGLNTAATSGYTKISECGITSAVPPTSSGLDTMGSIVCMDYAVGLGVANNCGVCFAGVYATMSTAGLNTALVNFMGVSPIEKFAMFSNCQASIIMVNVEVAQIKTLPAPLAEDLVRGINIFGTVLKPTSCETFGIEDVLCQLVTPYWPTGGFTLYSQLTISDDLPYTVTQSDIGIKVNGIPIKGPTTINEIDIKYSLVMPEVPDDPNEKPGLPSTAVEGTVEIGTKIDGQPLTFIGSMSMGVDGATTYLGASMSMSGIVALPTPMAAFKMSIYDLYASLQLGVTGGLPTIKEFLIGGGVCVGSDSACRDNYNKVGDLDDVIMASLYLGMMTGDDDTQFAIRLNAAPLSLKKLFNVINQPSLADALPSMLVNAELTGYKDCTNSSDNDCWVRLEANSGDESMEFDFEGLGVTSGGPDMTIDPGVIVGAGIKFAGGHGAILITADDDYFSGRLAMSTIYLFGGDLILSRSSSNTDEDSVKGGDSSGPIMKFDANYASFPPSVKFVFRAYLKLWDFMETEVYIKASPFKMSILATGVTLYGGALVADGFLVCEGTTGSLDLGVFILVSPLIEKLSPLISTLKSALNSVKSKGNAIADSAESVRSLLTKRFNSAKSKLDKAKKTLDDANDKLSAAEKKAKSVGCSFLQVDNEVNSTEDQTLKEGNVLKKDSGEDLPNADSENSTRTLFLLRDGDTEDSARALLSGRRRRKGGWTKAVKKVAKSACSGTIKSIFSAAKGAVDTAKGSVETAQQSVDALRDLSQRATAKADQVASFGSQIVTAVASAVSMLLNYKPLALGFKGSFQVGKTLGAAVEATLYYATDGRTHTQFDDPDIHFGLQRQFLPDDFQKPEDEDEAAVMCDSYTTCSGATPTNRGSTVPCSVDGCDASTCCAKEPEVVPSITFSIDLKGDVTDLAKEAFAGLFAGPDSALGQVQAWFESMESKFEQLEDLWDDAKKISV